jgi:copper chaperone
MKETMQTLQFKTTINCGGCIATVSPALNNNDKIQKWDVDTKSANKTLSITTDYTPKEVEYILQKLGFKAESI